MSTTRIIRNSARCLSCGEEVESKSRWDYVVCSCGKLAVDGGRDYLKRITKGRDDYEDTSQTITVEDPMVDPPAPKEQEDGRDKTH